MTTLAEVAAVTAQALRDAGVASPDVDARWLVEAASGIDPRRAPEVGLTDEAAMTLAGLVARRCEREPLQLVVGSTAFRTIELRCRPGVFVPRPETEVLAGLAIRLVQATRTGDQRPVVVHEPCCGTGAVGLAVASEVARAVVLLADVSEDAIALARENRDVLAGQGRLRAPVEVHMGPLLEPFVGSEHGPADVIVANPPYLPDADLSTLDPEVAVHDPRRALTGGPDGHELVDALLGTATSALVPGGAIVLEVDARRSQEAADVARRVGLTGVEVHEDLTGAPRFVLARRRGPDRSPGPDGPRG